MAVFNLSRVSGLTPLHEITDRLKSRPHWQQNAQRQFVAEATNCRQCGRAIMICINSVG